uniref:Putative charged multivesicular body protein n=1 Tax=Ornithodoros turicata TaxID=34597 RepID=A0A2R5LKW8_9ACAR
MDIGGFKFPVCWKDDVRMGALFNEFRCKDANPEGWQDKMDFWVALILQWSKETKAPVFSAFDLATAFERKRAQPACLQTVLAYMKRSGDLVSAQEHFSKDSWVQWGFDVLVKKPLVWMWGWSAGGEPLTALSEELVNVDVLKSLQKQVLAKCEQEKFAEDVVLYSQVWRVCQDICRDEKSFAYVLRGLEKAKFLKVYVQDEKKVVSFLNKDVVLSEHERALLKLQKVKVDLNRKVDQLQEQVEKCTQEAVQAKAQGLQNKALYALKKRRRVQAVLEKQFAMLDNIHSLEMNLGDKKDIQLIYDGYRTAAAALKTAHAGVDINTIDDIVTDIQDTLEDQNELSRVVSSVLVSTDPELDELEQELNRILELSELEEPAPEPDVVFPDVPTENPATPKKTGATEKVPLYEK